MGRIEHYQYLIQKTMLAIAWTLFLCAIGYMGGAMLLDQPEPMRGNRTVVLAVPPPAFAMAPVQPLGGGGFDNNNSLNSPVPVNVMPSSNIPQANSATLGNPVGHMIKLPDSAANGIIPPPALPNMANDIGMLDLTSTSPAAGMATPVIPQALQAQQLQAQQVGDESGFPINTPSPFAAVVPHAGMAQKAQTIQVQPNGSTSILPPDARVQPLSR